MAAPDLETLFNFESAIEPAILTRLEDLGITTKIRQGTDTLLSGRVDVELEMGGATGNLYIPKFLPDGPCDTRLCLEQRWSAMLNFAVITARDRNASLHRPYVAKIRVLMLDFFHQFPVELLPFHALVNVQSAGTAPGLVTEKDEDVTRLRYQAVVAIREGAWPDPY